MNKNTTNLLFDIIRSVLSGTPLTEENIAYTPELAKEILSLAKSHDIAHLVANYFLEQGILKESAAQFQTTVFQAIYRYEGQNFEYDRLCALLNQREISYLPLKGAILRKHYPAPWMRTSCDIDILVKKEDVQRAKTAIIEELGYEFRGHSTHDITLFSKGGVCLELHFDLKENDFRELDILTDVFSGAEVHSTSSFACEMSNELFLLYHIYHTAKHFYNGGCGIKPLIDLRVIESRMPVDTEKMNRLFAQNHLLEFYNHIHKLSTVWFDGKTHTPLSREMEDYILQGGVYGSLEQHLAMSQSRKGGKFKHLISKIFLSYRAMCVYYPSLEKCPILFPFYQVRRWLRILFFGGSKRAFREITLNQNLSLIKQQKAKRLMDALNLKR